MKRRAYTRLLGTAVAVVALAAVALAATSAASPRARAAYAPQCSYNGAGGSNFKSSNPLVGAHLFVESPWLNGGDVANAIAKEVGLGYLATEIRGTPLPWAAFKQKVNSLHLSRGESFRVHEMEKIGDYPMAHQYSLYTAGGSGNAIFTQTQYYLCRMQRTDPTAAAVITTYFIKHNGCTSGAQPNFQSEVDAFKDAVGNFPALIFVEEDAIDTICWRNPAVPGQRAQLLKYEIDQLSKLPNARLYVEGGTSDANSPSQVARVLNASDVHKIRGFFLNDTHFNWAYKEIQFANKVAQMTHGLHFVVDTRSDGQGPILNPHPVTQGIEELCNPPHRGLGPKPGPSDGRSYGMYSKHLDGFIWATTPGESTSPTCAGRSGHWANSGVFDPNIGVDVAAHANDRIGPSPRFKSRPW